MVENGGYIYILCNSSLYSHNGGILLAPALKMMENHLEWSGSIALASTFL